MMCRRYGLLLPLLLSVACVSATQAARQFMQRGERDLAGGRDEAAAIDFRNAVKNDPGSAEANRKLGDANVALGRSEEAYRAYLKAVTIDPTDAASQIAAGKLLVEAGRYDEAKMRADTVLEADAANVDARL